MSQITIQNEPTGYIAIQTTTPRGILVVSIEIDTLQILKNCLKSIKNSDGAIFSVTANGINGVHLKDNCYEATDMSEPCHVEIDFKNKMGKIRSCVKDEGVIFQFGSTTDSTPEFHDHETELIKWNFLEKCVHGSTAIDPIAFKPFIDALGYESKLEIKKDGTSILTIKDVDELCEEIKYTDHEIIADEFRRNLPQNTPFKGGLSNIANEFKRIVMTEFDGQTDINGMIRIVKTPKAA